MEGLPASAMNTSPPAQEDEVFEDLLAAFNTAEERLEAYLARPGESCEPRVRRVLVEQLRQAVWTHYHALCEHLHSRRQGLPEL
jgi:hypothetical protein